MDKKVATIVIFLIVLNWAFVWFGNMGFFEYGPLGMIITFHWAIDTFIITGLGLLGLIFSSVVKINAFALIMFIEVFWWPYIKASALIGHLLIDTPAAFATIEGIFGIIMLLIFAMALIEMSGTATTG